MLRDFQALPSASLPTNFGYAQPAQSTPARVILDSAAVDVMTDFTRVTAVIILPGGSIDEAHRRMIQRGVRLLLVVDQDRRLQGVMTAADVLGE